KILAPAYRGVIRALHTSTLQKLRLRHEDDTDFDVQRGREAGGNDGPGEAGKLQAGRRRGARTSQSSPACSLPACCKRPEAVYASWLMSSNSGRYIATTMPPTTTPRKQIRIGSSSVSSPAMATSTSSS